MRRTIFTEGHELFSRTARPFSRRECAPCAKQWGRVGTDFTEEHEWRREPAGTFDLRGSGWSDEQRARDVHVSGAAREAERKAGLIVGEFPEEYGGPGVVDFRSIAIIAEEMAPRS